MKTCREVHKEASALLDGQLPLVQALGVRMHLLLCTHCRRYVRHLRLLAHSLAMRARASSSPADFVERVTTHLECEQRPPRRIDRADST
jgi:anti-sigma factor RsiW